jgi:hypothetical protein
MKTLEGTLEMADFKPLGHKCRIASRRGKSVICTFDTDKEAEVLRLMRKPVRVTGEAQINSRSHRTEEIHIREIEPIDNPLMSAEEFFATKSISELAKIQGVKPLENPSILIGGWPADEDVDEFLEYIYKARSASTIQSYE